ncbi:MAG: aminotransferase class I/II-fold pyridoxal phosphate-dependent enzyme [FCB group bacterium]|nr:aminotransferase class I/II-fold pyridoxal phosphate-dependent enzyme [FCB group bacterium]
MEMKSNPGIHTRVTHAGTCPDSEHGSVATPIYQTSTFKFQSAEEGARRISGEENGFIYSRLGNPTTATLESAISELEGGAGALATASGMAAVNLIYLTFLGSGMHIVGTDALYGSSRRIIELDYSRFGVDYDFIDTSDPELLEKTLKPNTALVYLESPANPTLKLADIRHCTELAHRAGALVAVDNTFMSPLLQRPLEFGADMVIHSLTKYINGHTDVIGGMVIFRDEQILEQARPVHVHSGGCMDPHQAWLVLRGLKTMALRVYKAQDNARQIAEFLETDGRVSRVFYPGLKSHPQYELAQSQMEGPGSMISFELNGGLEAGQKLMDRVSVATLAVSLGGYETLIQHPASMTHAAVPREERLSSGITDGLVRLAVGCEDAEDIIADLDQALR